MKLYNEDYYRMIDTETIKTFETKNEKVNYEFKDGSNSTWLFVDATAAAEWADKLAEAMKEEQEVVIKTNGLVKIDEDFIQNVLMPTIAAARAKAGPNKPYTIE